MIRLKHDLREAVPLKDDVWACDNAASPFIFGILHPRIYVPAEMEPERLDDVIAHEQAHIDHKDHWLTARFTQGTDLGMALERSLHVAGILAVCPRSGRALR